MTVSALFRLKLLALKASLEGRASRGESGHYSSSDPRDFFNLIAFDS